MSRINNLISKLCPDGVEFKELGTVAAYSNTRIDARKVDEATFVGVDNLLANMGGRTKAIYAPNTARLTAYEAGDILLGNIRPYLKKIWLADAPGGCSGDVLAVRIADSNRRELMPAFLYRLLASDDFFAYNTQHAKGGKMPRGSKDDILKFRIPVPPPRIQQEIVEALDAFSNLTAELEAELEARRKQYEYYRDALLAFHGQEAHWTTMGEVGEFFRGRRFTKEDYDEDGIACIHYGDIYTQYGTAAKKTVSHVRSDMAPGLRFALPGDLVIAGVGETVEEVAKAVAWLGKDKVAIHDDCFAFRHTMNPKFVSYWFQTSAFHVEKARHVARAKVNRVSGEGLARVKIPVPSAEEQQRIVSILEKFDALVNDLSSGLPGELNARRAQYAHYRGRLLTFKEAA